MWRRRIAAQLADGAAAATLIVNRGARRRRLARAPARAAVRDAGRAAAAARRAARVRAVPQPLRRLRALRRDGGGRRRARARRRRRARGCRRRSRFSGELWLAPAEHQPTCARPTCGRWPRALRRALAAARTRRPAARRSTSGCTRRPPTCAAPTTGTSRWRRAPRHLAGFELGADIALVSGPTAGRPRAAPTLRTAAGWPQDAEAAAPPCSQGQLAAGGLDLRARRAAAPCSSRRRPRDAR